MNRKLLSIIVIATLLLASLVVLAACTGKELPTPHVCQFVKKDTVAPTCIEEGYTKYLCKDCNKEIRRDLVAINKTAHRYTSYASVDPECTMTKEGITLTTYGYTIKQCEYCNKYGFTVDEKTALRSGLFLPNVLIILFFPSDFIEILLQKEDKRFII